MKMKNRKISLPYIIFGLIFGWIIVLTIGWSAFSQNLDIDGMALRIEVKKDIRVTSLATIKKNNENGGTILEEDYDYNKLLANVTLPNENSKVNFIVEVTNFGNVEMGILKIDNLPDNLEIVLTDYTLEEKIDPLGTKREFMVTIKYKNGGYDASNTAYGLNLIFDFRGYHKIFYDGIENHGYLTEIMDGKTYTMALEKPYPIGAKPFYDSLPVEYYFDNDTLVVENVMADMTIRTNYIQTIEDLVTLSNYVSDGNSYKGTTFTLDKNLNFEDPNSYRNSSRTDFGNINGTDGIESLIKELTNPSGTGFKPIGNYTYYFKGNFDGGNHTLENLYIHVFTNNNQPERTVGSLFGFITDGEIRNLTIKGDLTTDQKANIGGVASYASNVSINNVHNYANVTSYGDGYSVGGIIGSVGNDNIGLLGDNIRITNCSNHGTIQGGNHGGGLVGAIAGESHLFVNDSYNAGIVRNSIITDAGILALNNGNCYMNNSYNMGPISTNGVGTSDSGAISLGGLIAANYETAFIINSYNTGSISYTGTKAASGSIAGLIGLVQGGGHILNSYNIGTISDSTSHTYVGGLANTVTWNNPVHKQIYNAYNAGTLSGGRYRYQIGYQYNGTLKDAFYKSGGGSASNVSGATEISDANMRLDPSNANSLAYKLNKGMADINLSEIQSDLINHGYNSNYFDLALNSWIIDSETGYPTFNR